MDRVKVYLDTSALFSAVLSETGGARLILKLGEAGVIALWVGPSVLQEAESVIERKSPKSKTLFALLLDRSRISVGEGVEPQVLETALTVVDYLPDAQVLAEAIALDVDYFVSFDRAHLIGNPRADSLPFPMGTAGDFLAWYRAWLADRSR